MSILVSLENGFCILGAGSFLGRWSHKAQWRSGEGDKEGHKGSKECGNRWVIMVANWGVSPLETLLDTPQRGYLSTHYHPTLDEGPGGLTFQHFFMAQGWAHSLGVNLFPLKLRALAPTRLKQVACDHQAMCRVLTASVTLSFRALFLDLQLGTSWLKRFVSSFCSAVSTLLGHVPGPGEMIALFTWG